MRGSWVPCLIVASLLMAWREAQADGRFRNILVGPVVGVAWGGERSLHFYGGAEGGPGFFDNRPIAGPVAARLNLGIEYRDGEPFIYLEGSGWFYVGGSVGVGYGLRTGVHPIGGIWEGLGTPQQFCETDLATIAIGYRYTGVHEIFMTPKFGWGEVCVSP